MFKSIVLFFALASFAQADELVSLLSPPEVSVVAGHTACAGTWFNADSSILGTCRVIRSSACSGRGCQPVTYTVTYIANWDELGVPTSAMLCKTIRHHAPQADVVTYAAGFDATNCFNLNLQATGSTIILDGVPYYYVTAGRAGRILANSNGGGFLDLP